MIHKYICGNTFKSILMSLKTYRPCSILFLFILMAGGCTKFIEIPAPKNQIVTATVYSNDATAIAAMRGIYSEMYKDGFASGSSGINLLGLSADELTNFSSSSDIIQFYSNSLVSTNGTVKSNFWLAAYKYIYFANGIIEGLAGSTGVSSSLNTQLEGEAKFIRAFCYYYLTALFGDVPLIISTDYRINAKAFRSPKNEVYQKVISDLLDSQDKLSSDYSNEGGKRIRPNKWAAKALLARVYLFTGDWKNAELYSTQVINNTDFGLESDLNNVFLSGSREAIWQLMPVVPNQNTNEALSSILVGIPTNAALSNQFINAFETGDSRKVNWVGNVIVGSTTYYYPFKYKVKLSASVTEYSMVLRVAEQYLIRAEARAQQNNFSGAMTDLNIIRRRGGLANTAANDKISLLLAVEQERRIELFNEWGHRWFDLIRTGRANAILSPIKTSNWQETDQLFPIPQSEILNNPNLIQNPGY